MSRQVALLVCVGAISLLEGVGCGGRTGALGGFDVTSGSGAEASGSGSGGSGTAGSGDAVSESGTFGPSGVASGGGWPSGSFATSGGAFSGTVVASGTFVGGSGVIGLSGSFGASGAAATGTVSASGTLTGGSGTFIGGSGTFGVPPPDAGVPGSIPPQVAAGCDALCAKEATAMCPNQGSTASCVFGCRLLLNNPSCAPQTNALFACETTSTVSCDASGKATLDACPVQTLLSAACFLQSTNDPTLAGACKGYCAGVMAAHCPNDTPGCQAGCQVVGNLIPVCDPAWKAYVTCADGATLACGNDGKAWAPSCIVQALQYLACTASGALTVSDAGP